MYSRFFQQLDSLVQHELEIDYRSMVFVFTFDPITHQAQFLSSSKFTILLNRELLNNLVSMATAQTDEPSNHTDAIACYKKGTFSLETYNNTFTERKMEMEQPHYAQVHYQLPTQRPLPPTPTQRPLPPTPTPQQLHQIIQEQMEEKMQMSTYSSENTSPRVAVCHEVSPTLGNVEELSKERIQSLPTPIKTGQRLCESKRKRSSTPIRVCSYQSVKSTIDDSTKLKIISAISPETMHK
ncbi:hypothetical protein EHI8A_165960 [Entamoeba histolytica HM-1:IMSS-B]|uniref:Uncharacterized protein n=6 Tax=Entamoeba histolytica TaxID=5759 RepID=C4LXD4_ENTH1|nr:hypothetical protein EHI_098540 [Entamoeba histolytica HM-1:IMSS]EMD46094.1 Hypothetical protein EHI5A_147480 [Entamoeba histolytica KU27]EMH72293.1 hypothetical protein EHI8A_165960 [Entamoeba histolytica HM-1:IMSS-B]EMS15395.1 hypothetical protein KM1_244140 [Entamoeba histolytica HM-3:IMSS]ENY61732.1 hypothetical protein EHI7A_152110 [Entamoeba histolytica HM-1:IMSS-A]GAT93411.1 hypothetical protein CL6EHI_098540 [Entamoeba histolytica]|eukprot:XP_655963.1 hypothetical protein EHI_098540 [Entamoeba histolytica HM-1:IMSS]